MVALFVVLTFIIFLVVDYFVLRSQKKEHPAFASKAVFDKNSMFFPAAYMLSKGHIWLQTWKKDMYKLGLDEFIIKALKKVTVSEIAAEGTAVSRGSVILKAKSGSREISFRSPIDGTVVQVNKNLINKTVEDTYNEDWGLVIQPSEGQSFAELKNAGQAKGWLNAEFKRLKDFLTLHTAEPELAGLTMADGGNVIEGVVSMLPESTVAQFENDFLMQ